jgi:hypothetical protein
MQIQAMEIFRSLLALVAGILIGLGFGLLQNLGLRRNQKLQQSGALKNEWGVVPGSMRRVAYLLVALVLVQLLCPLLFVNGSQWWVSGGVVLGYGAFLSRRLLQR